jgi:hypothetical protein
VPSRLPVRVLTAGLIAALAGAMALPAAAQEIDRPAFTPDAEQTQATQTLAQAKALFAGTGSAKARSAESGEPEGRDATMLLRDLARQAGDLPTAGQRATAARILARPTLEDGSDEGPFEYTTPAGSYCGPHICVHWVEDTSRNSVQGANNDLNITTVPAWVKTTLATMESVYAKEVTSLGYRAPLPDGILGGSAKTDVYLADVGAASTYGYCGTDQPNANNTRAVFAYCVLDNDYATSQFRTNTPLLNLRVTAAHEFFHAVQFAYDWTEDLWLMEGTAAWMEDEVYDGVNDNLQYLVESPLNYPYVPLDYWEPNVYMPYGSWVFWKFLSESTGAGAADNPGVIRRVWNAAGGSTYSTQALKQVLVARGSNFPRTFSQFGTWTRNPGRYFSEGRYQKYPRAPLEKSFTLSSARRSTGYWTGPLDHMAHSFVRFVPGSTLTGKWRLRVSVNMANRSRGSVARVVVHKRSGGIAVWAIPLSATGNGSRVFGFRRAYVKDIELEMGNTSTRFRCDQDTTLSCAGTAYDDRLPMRFAATAIR